MFTVSDLGQVWAEINVPAKDLPLVRWVKGQHQSHGIRCQRAGTITFVGALIGEQTRMAKARVVLANPRARASRPVRQCGSDRVRNRRASQRGWRRYSERGDNPVVFVKVKVACSAQPVQLGRSDGKRVEVLQGLQAGAAYAAAGGFVVKSELSKASDHTRDAGATPCLKNLFAAIEPWLVLLLPPLAWHHSACSATRSCPQRRAGHHQRPGSDQHRCSRIFAVGDRATGDLSIETVMAGLATTWSKPACRAMAVPGDRDLQGRHRHLLCRQLVNERIQEAGINCRSASHRRWGRSPPAWGNLPVDGRGQGRREKPDGTPYTPTRPARDPGLDHQAAVAQPCPA